MLQQLLWCIFNPGSTHNFDCLPSVLVCTLTLQVKELVLIEVEGGLVRHERLIKAVAAAIDEDITVTVLPVHRL